LGADQDAGVARPGSRAASARPARRRLGVKPPSRLAGASPVSPPVRDQVRCPAREQARVPLAAPFAGRLEEPSSSARRGPPRGSASPGPRARSHPPRLVAFSTSLASKVPPPRPPRCAVPLPLARAPGGAFRLPRAHGSRPSRQLRGRDRDPPLSGPSRQVGRAGQGQVPASVPCASSWRLRLLALGPGWPLRGVRRPARPSRVHRRPPSRTRRAKGPRSRKECG
jgi:hypothetical protein